jgi:phosphoribosylaminoimidazole-succinocarboxamide synthase
VELLHRGKVRDVYSDRPGEVILVATDRVSVYDVVLPTAIPDKGKLLTSLSLWWFEQLADVMPNHVISATDVPAEFEGRAVRFKQVDVVQVGCIARGYLASFGRDAYRETGKISGVSRSILGCSKETSFPSRYSRLRSRLRPRMGTMSR